MITRYTHDMLAWEYDQRNPGVAPDEVAWYRAYADRTDGPILELACGSGRLLLPLAALGYAIDGVDSSPAMLARLQARRAGLDAATQRRIRTFQADMRTFVPDRRYGLVVVAYNSLRSLEQRAQVAQLVTRIAHMLQPMGALLCMVTRPNLTPFANGQATVVDWLDTPLTNRSTGVQVGSRVVSRLDAVAQQIVMERYYRIVAPDGHTEEISEVSRVPVIEVAEYRTMVQQAGLVPQVFSGYDERPDDGTSPLVCITGRPRA